MTKITAGRGTLSKGDFLRSFVVAVITPIATLIIDSINAGNFEINWNHIWKTAVAAGLAYLVKNMLEPSKVVISDPAKVEAVKAGETITVTPKK